MSSLDFSPQHVPLVAGPDGAIRFRGTRVLFELVVRAYWNGSSPEDIVRMYDTLDLADTYSVLAYYLKHRSNCDDYLRDREALGAEARAKWDELQRFPTNFRAVLMKRHKAASNVVVPV